MDKEKLEQAFKAGRISVNTSFKEWYETFAKEYEHKEINDLQDFSEEFPRELKEFWNQACQEQIELCSDKCHDLLNTDGDAESWPDKILKTNNAEYPY